MSGIDFVKIFRIPKVIVVTGKNEYIAEALDYSDTDFYVTIYTKNEINGKPITG